MKYYQGPPLGRDGRKPKKWIKRPEIERRPVYDGLEVFAVEAGCHEAIAKINEAAAAGNRAGVAAWRKTLEARYPGLRRVLRASGATLEPAHRAKLQLMDRELTRLLRPRSRA